MAREPTVEQYNKDTLERTVRSLFTIFTNDGERVNIAERHLAGIEEAVKSFLVDNAEYQLIGASHLATSRSHLVLDQPRPGFWVADSATAAWGVNVATAYTNTNLFPTTANAIRLDAPPPFREYLFGFADVGSMNSVVLIDYVAMNNTRRTVTAPLIQSRLSTLKILELDPGLVVKERGTKNINAQFETAGSAQQVQIIPLAVEILPFEVAQNQDVSSFVTEV